jgi:HSP20 family protein
MRRLDWAAAFAAPPIVLNVTSEGRLVMANIMRRNQGNRELAGAPAGGTTFDPFRLMRDMLRFDPFRELELGFLGERGFSPSFDVKETKDAYVFRADVPGLKEEDVQISLTGNRLTISGSREQERQNEGEQYYASEISYGSFTRSFTLPDGTDPDAVQADMKNGVLTVSIPKKPEVQPRKIPVGRGAPPPTEKAKA